MQKNRLLITIAASALLLNIIMPGLAFGQASTDTLGLSWQPTCGTYSLSLLGDTFDLSIVETGLTEHHAFATAAPSGGAVYQNGTANVPAGALSLRFSDMRSGYAGPGCGGDGDLGDGSGSLEGFTISAYAPDFELCTAPDCSTTDPLTTIPSTGFWIATTKQVDTSVFTSTYCNAGTGAWTNDVYICDPSGGYGTATINDNLIGGAVIGDGITPANTTDFNNYSGIANSLGDIAFIVYNTGEVNDLIMALDMFVAPVFYLEVPTSTVAGTYQTTITYTMSPAE